jgi:hypothetical protein
VTLGRLIGGIAVGAVVVLTPLSAPSAAPAHWRGVVLKAGVGIAKIDGRMAPREWTTAAHLDFQANLIGGGTTPARIYVMNDAENLYLAFRVRRSTLGETKVGVWFDNDHDRRSSDGKEDGVSAGTGGQPVFQDEFRCTYRGKAQWCLDISRRGRSDGDARAKNDGTWSFYELSHPLSSGDKGHDLAVAGGAQIGFTALVEFDEGQDSVATCVVDRNACNILDPKTFGDIVIARAEQEGVVQDAWMSRPGSSTPIKHVRATAISGLQANFRFSIDPVKGSTLRVKWFRDQQPQRGGTLTPLYDRRTKVVTVFFKSARVTTGLYAAELSVRPPGASFHPIATATATVE